MKKNLYLISFCVVIGAFIGTYLFSKYSNIESTNVSATSNYINQNIYVIQIGVYSNKENMINNIKKINYVYEIKDNKYYVYVGMTKNEKNLEKLKQYFKNNNIYVKQIEVNGAFVETLEQYDLLLNEAESNESISTILKSILAKFEELGLDDKNQRITNK